MAEFDGEKMGQAFMIVVVAIGAAWRFLVGLRKPDTAPPPDREPSVNEWRAAMIEVRDKLDTNKRLLENVDANFDRLQEDFDRVRDEFREKHGEIVRNLHMIDMELRGPYRIRDRDNRA